MKKEKIIKILIPFIAVIVIVESVILVSNLGKSVPDVSDVALEVEEVTPTKKVSQPVVDFIFETKNKEMKIGKPFEVSLGMVGKKEINLDSIEIYIKYDPSKVEISKLNVSSSLPKVDRLTKIDDQEGLISSIILWGEGKKYSMKTNELDPILSFMVTPKVKGKTEISILDDVSGSKYSSFLIENITSNKLLPLSNKLEINAVN